MYSPLYEKLLDEARNNRTADNYEAYLKNYEVLIAHMVDEAVCIEVFLGDIYLETIGHAEKSMRYRNPPGHPLTLLAEYYYLLMRTTNVQFKKEFPIWVEKNGRVNAMQACLKFLEVVKEGYKTHQLPDIIELVGLDWTAYKTIPLSPYILKTIVAITTFDHESVYCALEFLHKIGDKKIPNEGAYFKTMATECIKSLEKMGTTRALQSLYRIERYARYTKPQKYIQSLEIKLNLTEQDMEDLKAPTFEFDENLCREEIVKDLTVTMRLLPDYKIAWKLTNAEGNEYFDVSSPELKEYKSDFKDLKTLEKTIFQEIRYQRDRLEQTYRNGKEWAFTNWLVSVIKHPIIGYSAHRLIWVFTNQEGERFTGLWTVKTDENEPTYCNSGVLIDAQGNELPSMDDTWIVKLWHPVEANEVEQNAWKDLVISLKVVQPFKQAFRETYTVSQTELQTRTYSNRFAAHILFKQQCLAIAAGIGWTVPSISSFYSDNFQNFFFTHILDLRIDFVVDFEWGAGTNMSTDRVTFDNDAELVAIPAIVFSEAMRDIDLFVSVCSIGIDPTWTPDREGYAYWSQYSTGELGDSARNRKDVLQRILQGLSIADRCRIEERWLFVKGDLCTYKIHLGSGSVHMEPDNRHLCIVPKAVEKTDTGKIYLPFESDFMLSLILSKAFLLAKDSLITDRSILSQINK